MNCILPEYLLWCALFLYTQYPQSNLSAFSLPYMLGTFQRLLSILHTLLPRCNKCCYHPVGLPNCTTIHLLAMMSLTASVVLVFLVHILLFLEESYKYGMTFTHQVIEFLGSSCHMSMSLADCIPVTLVLVVFPLLPWYWSQLMSLSENLVYLVHTE